MTRGRLCLWQKLTEREMDGNDCVREGKPDIYAHICDLGSRMMIAD